MHVLHVITKGDVGGAQTHVIELSGAQLAAGIRVTVVAGTDGPAMERCAAAGCEVIVIPTLGEARTRVWQREALRDLTRAISSSAPDIVHAHSSNAGFVARLTCRRLGVPCVYTAHGWPFQRGAAWTQRVLSFAGEFVGGRLGDGVICLTDVEADRARRARVVRRDHVWVIPNGLADVTDDLVHRHADGPPRFVMVARFAPPKGQRALVEAMSRCVDLDWSLTFVGDGPGLEECRIAADRLLGARVRFLGHRDDVPDILADHDVLVLWSAYEGLPISILEGMRAGLCCIASDLAGVRVLLPPGTGLVAGTTQELIEAVRSVASDPPRRTELGQAARREFGRRFVVDAVRRRVDEVYRDLLERRA